MFFPQERSSRMEARISGEKVFEESDEISLFPPFPQMHFEVS